MRILNVAFYCQTWPEVDSYKVDKLFFWGKLRKSFSAFVMNLTSLEKNIQWPWTKFPLSFAASNIFFNDFLVFDWNVKVFFYLVKGIDDGFGKTSEIYRCKNPWNFADDTKQSQNEIWMKTFWIFQTLLIGIPWKTLHIFIQKHFSAKFTRAYFLIQLTAGIFHISLPTFSTKL